MSDKYKMMSSIINALELNLKGYKFDGFMPRSKFEETFNLKQQYSPLYKQLEILKKDESLTVFEFLKDENNWSFIETHFQKQKINDFEISNDLLELYYSFLKSSLFVLDFNKAFMERIQEYKLKNKNIYNPEFENDEDLSFFTLYGNNFKVCAQYHYYLSPIDKMVFSIEQSSDNDNFILNMDLQYQGLLNKTREGKAIFKKYRNTFKSQSFDLPVNKANLNNFFDVLFEDINMNNVIDLNIFNALKEKSKEKEEYVSNLCLNRNLKIKDIKELLPKEIKEKTRVLFDFDITYPLCLAYDINKKFDNCFNVRNSLSGINLMVLGFTYHINIKKFKLELTSEDRTVFLCEDIRKEPNLTNLICENIRCDCLENVTDYSVLLDDNLKKISLIFKNMFPNVDLEVIYPEIKSFSLQNISRGIIPVKLSSDFGSLELIVEINKTTDLLEKEELKRFREKLLINSSLKNAGSLKNENKKRL